MVVVVGLTLIVMTINAFTGGDSLVHGRPRRRSAARSSPSGRSRAIYIPIISILFLANFLILFGPMLILGIQQIKAYEPGDADWGVKLADVRGQAEAKEEITRVVSLWQSGEEFVKAGGKRERGVLFLGPAGHRQDDALQGHRHVVQLPVRDDPGLGLRADLHRHGRRARALAGVQGQAARLQVGRPVHRVHRRDRRRRPPARRARDRLRAAGRPDRPRPPLLRAPRRADAGRRPRAARPRPGGSGCSRCAPRRAAADLPGLLRPPPPASSRTSWSR